MVLEAGVVGTVLGAGVGKVLEAGAGIELDAGVGMEDGRLVGGSLGGEIEGAGFLILMTRVILRPDPEPEEETENWELEGVIMENFREEVEFFSQKVKVLTQF